MSRASSIIDINDDDRIFTDDKEEIYPCLYDIIYIPLNYENISKIIKIVLKFIIWRKIFFSQ